MYLRSEADNTVCRGNCAEGRTHFSALSQNFPPSFSELGFISRCKFFGRRDRECRY